MTTKIRMSVSCLQVLIDHLKYTISLNEKDMWEAIEEYLFTGECDYQIPDGVVKLMEPIIDSCSDLEYIDIYDKGIRLYRGE